MQVWVRARQRMSFGFDLGLIWVWRANVAGEQLLREHLSGEHLSWNPFSTQQGAKIFQLINDKSTISFVFI
jgi:hypothetical protein